MVLSMMRQQGRAESLDSNSVGSQRAHVEESRAASLTKELPGRHRGVRATTRVSGGRVLQLKGKSMCNTLRCLFGVFQEQHGVVQAREEC